MLIYARLYALTVVTSATSMSQTTKSVPCEGTREPTQLILKQSWEQKKLSFPSFRHVGHCRVPASFGQSAPMHCFFAEVSAAMTTTYGWASEGSSGRRRLRRKQWSVSRRMHLKIRPC